MRVPNTTIVKDDVLLFYKFYKINNIIDKNRFGSEEVQYLPLRDCVYKEINDLEYMQLEDKRINAKIYKGKYYKMTECKIYDDNEKLLFVEEFLNSTNMIEHDSELLEQFDNNRDYLLEESNKCLPQNNSQKITSTYTRALELISTYLCEDDFKEYKHSTLESYENDTGEKYRYNSVTENDDCKLSKNVSWNNSKTKKLNDLFSYDNFKDIKYVKMWLDGNKEHSLKKYHIKRDRLINSYEPYTAEWKTIDVDGCFEFKGLKFNAMKFNPQYKGEKYSDNMYKDEFSMDKVLCIEQYGEYYFFDENIDRIAMFEIEEIT